MYRTTNVGIAVWLVSCGHELATTDKDNVTGQLAYYFDPDDKLSADVNRYRLGDGIEETTARRCNNARVQLSARNLRRSGKITSNVEGAGHE